MIHVTRIKYGIYTQERCQEWGCPYVMVNDEGRALLRDILMDASEANAYGDVPVDSDSFMAMKILPAVGSNRQPGLAAWERIALINGQAQVQLVLLGNAKGYYELSKFHMQKADYEFIPGNPMMVGNSVPVLFNRPWIDLDPEIPEVPGYFQPEEEQEDSLVGEIATFVGLL